MGDQPPPVFHHSFSESPFDLGQPSSQYPYHSGGPKSLPVASIQGSVEGGSPVTVDAATIADISPTVLPPVQNGTSSSTPSHSATTPSRSTTTPSLSATRPQTTSSNSTTSQTGTTSATTTSIITDVPTISTPGPLLGSVNAQQTPTSLSASSTDSGFSTGAIAGVAVACAIGAAIIAFLFTFLCMRRRNKKQLQHGPRKIPSDLDEKSSGALLLPPQAPDAMGFGNQPAWMNQLPPPESEAKIGELVATMYDTILRHANKYYQDVNVDLNSEMKGKLETVDSNHLPESVVDMLPRTMHPTALIKHCIANEIISRISSTGGNAETFLPEDYVNLPKAISNASGNWRHPGAFDPAFSQWRVLTSYLRPPPSSDPTHQDSVQAIIKEAAAKLSATFSSWAMTDYSLQERQEDLMSVMREAAKTGTLIFAQPSTFTFKWTDSSMLGNAVEVTPFFLKAMDEDGRRLERQPVLVQGRAESV